MITVTSPMGPRKKVRWIGLGALAICALVALHLLLRNPVVCRIPAFGSTIRQEPLFVFFGPLRDRGPEHRAEDLLHRLKAGACEDALSETPMGLDRQRLLCEKLREYPLVSWELADREDDASHVDLTYHHWSGDSAASESMVIRLSKNQGTWVIREVAIAY